MARRRVDMIVLIPNDIKEFDIEAILKFKYNLMKEYQDKLYIKV